MLPRSPTPSSMALTAWLSSLRMHSALLRHCRTALWARLKTLHPMATSGRLTVSDRESVPNHLYLQERLGRIRLHGTHTLSSAAFHVLILPHHCRTVLREQWLRLLAALPFLNTTARDTLAGHAPAAWGGRGTLPYPPTRTSSLHQRTAQKPIPEPLTCNPCQGCAAAGMGAALQNGPYRNLAAAMEHLCSTTHRHPLGCHSGKNARPFAYHLLALASQGPYTDAKP